MHCICRDSSLHIRKLLRNFLAVHLFDWKKEDEKEKRDLGMKKYLLLIEDERLWERFKEIIDKDLNSEIMELIMKKVDGKGGKNAK